MKVTAAAVVDDIVAEIAVPTIEVRQRETAT